MKVKFGGKLFQTKLLSARLLHKICRLLSSPVLLRKFTNTVTLKYSAYFAFYTRSVFYIYPVGNPQPAVPIFIPPDLKRFTLCSILQQGYNKSLITSEKTFSLFLGKRLSHDTCRLWINVGVTFPLETARRRHGRSFTTRRPPFCLQSRHFRFYAVIFSYISPTYSEKRLEESNILFHDFG